LAAKRLEVADIRRQKSEFVDISCRYVALSHVQPSRSLSTETERRRPPGIQSLLFANLQGSATTSPGNLKLECARGWRRFSLAGSSRRMIAAVVRRSSFRGVVDHCCEEKDEDALMLCGKQMCAFFVVMFQVLYLASLASRIASDKRKLMNDVNTALSSSSITLTTSPRLER
jgi:hypothetical protein